ncbi:MAG TPA: P-loop NTPase fold protein, partial [Chthoniobacterales bacterium]
LLSNDIVDLDLVSPSVAYAVTAAGEIIGTRDGAKTWRLLRPPRAQRVRFSDEKYGIAITESGLSSTSDGGRTWQPTSEPGQRLSNIILAGGFSGIAVGSGIFEIGEGKTGPILSRPLEIAALKRPDAVFLGITKAGENFVACGEDGTIARSVGTRSWQALPSGVDVVLNDILFTSDAAGWAVGDGGIVLVTTDGGNTWQKQTSGTGATLNAVFFPTPERGFGAGAGGTLIGTEDGGRRWFPVVTAGTSSGGRHAWLPAPWYFLSLVLLFAFVRKIPNEIAPPKCEAISPKLASDKPLEPEDADYLGFQQVAWGLSNYLRNNETKAPLTIAITGEWGMGKTSLMNLLRADLRQYKFRPVWFNAWHHQTEEHLLAALLENVRTQAIPPVFTPEGLVFRTKLLWLRARRHLFVSLLLIAAVSFCVSYFVEPGRLQKTPDALVGVAGKTTEFISRTLGSGQQTAMSKDQKEAAKEQPEVLLVLATALGSLIAFLKALQVFGVNPASLLASKSNAAKASDLRAQTSFRHKFATEFREVSQSLDPLTMVLYVDDLDRCRPEQVYEMLEAINFLISCGDCFVVMGLARRRVERCIGLVFEKVAGESPDQIDGRSLTEADKRHRFAHEYLEKLINIEVPVPKAEANQFRTLLTSKAPERPPQSRFEVSMEKIGEMLPHLIPATLCILTAVIAAWWSMRTFPPLAETESAKAPAVEASAPAVQATVEVNAAATSPLLTSKPDGKSGIGSAKFYRGETGRAPLWAMALVAAAILVPGIIRLSRRTGAVIEDSDAFVKALDEWFPFLMGGTHMTPRGIKRFVNRVRYFAMMEGSFRPAPRWWERLARFFTKEREPVAGLTRSETEEDLLVGLATVHERHPDWFVGGADAFRQNMQELSPDDRTELPRYRDVSEVDDATYDHFKKLVAGVEVR